MQFLDFETINYMGSKRKMLSFLFSHIQPSELKSFFDGFSGSGRVCGSVKHLYKNVTACDKQIFSNLLCRVLLTGTIPIDIDDKIKFLNAQKGKDGFLSQFYGGSTRETNSSIQEDGKTRLFEIKNAQKIQSIRDLIEDFPKEEKDYLLYCLILSAAKVQSSTGHQNGYLKTFSPNSLKPLELKIQNINHEYNNTGNKTCIGDVFDFISAPHDIFYFDPPYGTCNYHVPVATRYTAFYHFWNTLILNDSPEVFGKANRRIDSKGVTDKFEVNKKETFLPLLKRLFEESNGKDVFVSLSNQSVVNKEDVLDYMNLPIRVYEIAHAENVQGKKVRKDGEFSVKKKPLVEYLYHLEK